MKVIIFGDFNCPYSYLASQRADRLARDGTAEIDWRAIEHDRSLPVTGTRSSVGRAAWDAELAGVRALALPGERTPSAPPPIVSNTKAAVAAYAEAVSDGIADELRRRVFRAMWDYGRNVSSAYEVRRLLTGLMWQPGPLRDRLSSPDLPDALDHDADLARIVRRSGGTITPDGAPLTTAGYRRVRRWRQQWLALLQPAIPAVISTDGTLYPGTSGLRFLAGLAGGGGTTSSPAGGSATLSEPGSGMGAGTPRERRPEPAVRGT